MDLDPETQACTTIGAKEGFSHLMWVLLGPGDAALVPSPSYPIHIWGPILAGAEVRHVRLGPEQDFFANLLEAWEDSWPRPRVIVLSFPHNPTTACVDLEFMTRVVAFAREHDVLLVHDFAYADLGFDGYAPPSILQVPGATDVAVELYTLTKSFSMAGWRVGFLLGNAEVVGALAKLKSYLDYGTFQPIQIAATVAMNEVPDHPAEVNAVYRRRRDALVDGLARVGWAIERPRGTMFVWAPIPTPVRGPRQPGIRQAARAGGEGRGVAGRRVRSRRRGVRALRAGRERAPHRPGRTRRQAGPHQARLSAATGFPSRSLRLRPSRASAAADHPLARRTPRAQSARRAVRSTSGAGTKARSSRQAAAAAEESHTPSARPARSAAPSAVDSSTAVRRTAIPSTSAWNWHSTSIVLAPPSTRSSATGVAADAEMASTTSAVCHAIASTAARTMSARVVPRVIPKIAPRTYGSHHGDPSPVRAGTNTTPPVSGTPAREWACLRRGLEEPQPVTQPLDRRTRHEDRALERVRHLGVAARPGDRGHEPVHGRRPVGPDVDQHEGAGAVRVLRHARLEARLPEQGGLLVARDAAHRDPEPGGAFRVGGAEAPGAREHGRQARTRDAEQRGQLVRPLERVDVEHHGAARVRRLGRVHPAVGAPGEVPEDPRVDRADGERAGRRHPALAEQPLELGGGEVRVEHEAGPGPDQRFVALLAQLVASRRGATVLPHERTVHGPAGGAVPGDHRLPLVGDPDRDDVGRVDAGDDVDERGLRRGPDLVRVVFDPCRTWEVLGELAVGEGAGATTLVERHGAHPGGSGIDREHGHHGEREITDG